MRPLPPRIDPSVIAAEQRLLEGSLPLAAMPRLCAVVDCHQGEARLRLQGRIDEAGYRLLDGHVQTQLEMQCQRCMQAVKIAIDTDFLLALVASEQQATRLPDDYEPLIAEGEELLLAELVEDELLLGLPLVARHELGECRAGVGDTDSSPVDLAVESVVEDKYKPFAGLDKLLLKRTD